MWVAFAPEFGIPLAPDIYAAVYDLAAASLIMMIRI
jgi:hypothetical protein